LPRGVPGSKAPHGTWTRYVYHGCRCLRCKAHATAYMREQNGAMERGAWLASIEPPHGSEGRYVHWGCRCDDCKRASREARAKRRARATPADLR